MKFEDHSRNCCIKCFIVYEDLWYNVSTIGLKNTFSLFKCCISCIPLMHRYLLIQPILLHQPQWFKKYHLLVLLQQVMKLYLWSFIKVLKNKFLEFKFLRSMMKPSSTILLQTRVLENHLHKGSFDQILISSINRLVISASGQRLIRWWTWLQSFSSCFDAIWCYFDAHGNPMLFGKKWSDWTLIYLRKNLGGNSSCILCKYIKS